jgi:hypothetical protein
MELSRKEDFPTNDIQIPCVFERPVRSVLQPVATLHQNSGAELVRELMAS